MIVEVVGFHLNSGAVQMICSVGKLNYLLLRIRNMEPNFSLQLLYRCLTFHSVNIPFFSDRFRLRIR